ncbi:DDE superfamily endonuclease [Actinoplanes regularis]|uniref:DDE superfamily endonuclease n=1 Tax=Actinoplanes regularis TaxID=52697 RepID=A0A239IYR2_9ACTN|nr:DDE superfamily endonuclease [Actinoplanes regularis]
MAWRHVRGAIDLLAVTADDLTTAMKSIRLLAYAILDGTQVPIDRVADQKPYYSGKHRRHGVNVQVIADPAGRLIWASAALPGSVDGLTAARTHTIIDTLTNANVMTFADKAYQGARGSIRTPFKRHRYRPKLSRWQKKVNRAHAKIRAIGERANATLRTWKVLTRLRCSPHRATRIGKAILVLHHDANPTYRGYGSMPRDRTLRIWRHRFPDSLESDTITTLPGLWSYITPRNPTCRE